MKASQQDIDQRLAHFYEACRKSRESVTPQRQEIFLEVAQTEDHPDVEMIYKAVRRRIPTLSLDTVYRVLRWLEGLGLITTTGPPRQRTRFEANLNRHHHFECVQCGLIRDFYSEELYQLSLPESIPFIGHAETTLVEVKSVCHKCAEQEKTRLYRRGLTRE